MKRLKISILILLISACSGEAEQTENKRNIIPKEELISLIVDLQVLQEHYHNLFVRPDIYRDALDSASRVVFEDYGTNKDEYDASLRYYSKSSDEFYAIYEAALDTINFRINATAGK